jgi:putative flavoprotein involved in K+ transport
VTNILDVVVVGAGWAGLSVSQGLRAAGVPHVVIERGRIGETWRTQRWDSFHFNLPNVLSMLPGDRYEGNEPEGAMTRDEFVALLEDYAARHSLPIQVGESVVEVTPDTANGFVVRTDARRLIARNVVAASGSLNRARRPVLSRRIPEGVAQLDASSYRSAAALEPGAVLVVGSGQSGGQIAKDLVDAGREVFLATSKTGRLVRHYRGRLLAFWLVEAGALEQRREEFVLPSGAVPARSLQGALETLSLQALSAQGVTLLGRLEGVDGMVLRFGDDAAANLNFADEAAAALRGRVDDYIARQGITAPPATDDPAEVVAAKLPSPPIRSLSLAAHGIRTVIWCTGFDGDFSWLNVPGALTADRQPIHVSGIGEGGLYYPGLDFAVTRKSGTILAAAEEASTIVTHICERLGRTSVSDQN